MYALSTLFAPSTASRFTALVYTKHYIHCGMIYILLDSSTILVSSFIDQSHRQQPIIPITELTLITKVRHSGSQQFSPRFRRVAYIYNISLYYIQKGARRGGHLHLYCMSAPFGYIYA